MVVPFQGRWGAYFGFGEVGYEKWGALLGLQEMLSEGVISRDESIREVMREK